nr:hypothetical protein [Tanacetum cinerariifolium]
NEEASNVFQKEREQYFKIQDLKAQMQDKNIAISELKKLIEKGKGKSVDTKFDKPSVVRQPNAQRIPTPLVLGGLAPFSNSLDRIYFPKTKSVPKANVSEGVNHKPTVSRPQLKINQSKDKVLPNNSQVKAKKTQVEVHPRIPSVYNKTKSVTACKDSLNSRTLNANPTVVPISTRKPKSRANKSVATPHKKKVATKSTNLKPQSYFKVLYENTWVGGLTLGSGVTYSGHGGLTLGGGVALFGLGGFTLGGGMTYAGVGGLTLGGVTYSRLGGLTLCGGVALFGLGGFTFGGGVTYVGVGGLTLGGVIYFRLDGLTLRGGVALFGLGGFTLGGGAYFGLEGLTLCGGIKYFSLGGLTLGGGVE